MSAYNFQKQFAPLVETGEKRQTIRAMGKRKHAACGERVQLYTGMRTKSCRKLVSPDPVCTSVQRVNIIKVSICSKIADAYLMYLDGKQVFIHEIAEIAHADGFEDIVAFFNFFQDTHGMPFNGVLIKWEF